MDDTRRAACDALLKVFAYADEACAGFGIPRQERESQGASSEGPREATDAEAIAWTRLVLGGTLCTSDISARVRVLPKMHTPRVGCTLRSLSANLGLYVRREVSPSWQPAQRRPQAEAANSLNLLVLPWPEEVYPSHFLEVPGYTARFPRRGSKPPRSGLFAYSRPEWTVTEYARLLALLSEARRQVRRVDGLVFPELALRAAEWAALKAQIKPGSPLPELLVAGVGDGPRPGAVSHLGRNYAGVVSLALGADQHGQEIEFQAMYEQDKHHRWLLDARQLLNYHLGANLDGSRDWWEAIEVRSREVRFLAMSDWLTLCVLLCEDLARQDPVAELLRTVGPNLIIVLLMDGPQIPSRWSGRYATVLADDPGSAVLTVTSLGMAERSRPPGLPLLSPTTRTIGLWKDSRRGDCVAIELPREADAAVLTINRTAGEERTLDGRSDDRRSAHLELTGIHPIRAKDHGNFIAEAERLFLSPDVDPPKPMGTTKSRRT
jgi:hypothetical protein